jgi:hypothetical protein
MSHWVSEVTEQQLDECIAGCLSNDNDCRKHAENILDDFVEQVNPCNAWFKRALMGPWARL